MRRALGPLAAIAALLAASAQAAADTPALLGRVDALAAEVSALRGLPVRQAIARDAVDKAELARRLDALMDQEKAELERSERVLKHWGLLLPDAPYRAMLSRLLVDQIAGYYDHRLRRLTLTISQEADDNPTFAEAVLAHEIHHALQDQAFQLESFLALSKDNDDAVVARSALVEGDGVAVMIALLARRVGAARFDFDRAGATQFASMLATPLEGLEDIPLVLRESLVFPYTAGVVFVGHLYEHGGWARVDAAFRKPPASTEQILHPERYDAAEAPVVVPKLEAPAALRGSATTYETVWGEAMFSIFLRQHGVAAEVASAAADGWGGDRVSIVQLGDGREVGVARLLWDTENDAIEAQRALLQAVGAWQRARATTEDRHTATWLSLGGRLTAVARRGRAILLVHDVPLSRAARLFDELWRELPQPASPAR